MRLNNIEKESIINSIKEADPNAKIWLFGSRTDDNKKGGDIDIAILSNLLHNNTMQIIKVKRSIFNKIGEQQIDIVTSRNGQDIFFKNILSQGIELTSNENQNRSSIDILKLNISTLNSSLNRLLYSFNVCGKIGIKFEYSDEEFVEFEAMTSRYARTVDMLVNKVLRSLDAVEYIDSGTIIDIMNRAEKREIVSQAEILHTLKDLRNSIAHEYKTEEIPKFFEDVLKYTPILLELISNTNKYCEKYLKYVTEEGN